MFIIKHILKKMITDLIQGSFYDVFKNDGILLVQNIEYSGRGDDEKFIFIKKNYKKN